MPPRRPRNRRILAAKLVAQGKTTQEAADALGVSRSAVNKAVTSVLSYERFEDIRNCRVLAFRRLDSYRTQLLQKAGLKNPETLTRPDGRKVRASLGELAAVVRILVQIEKREAEMFGIDAPQHIVTTNNDALESMKPEELLAYCRERNIEVPPGLADLVALRAKGSDSTDQSGRGSPPKAG